MIIYMKRLMYGIYGRFSPQVHIKCLTLAPSFQIIDDFVGVSSLLDNHFVPCLYITE